MKLYLALFCLLFASLAQAGCPVAEKIEATKDIRKALPIYITCALDQNDDETQLKLARLYRDGQAVRKNLQRALLFYHLSADNGNASAMVEMSTLLTQMDENDSSRAEISAYLEKIQKILKGNRYATFQGELLHPYALLVLANEAPADKWFYPSKVKSDSRSSALLKSYVIDPEKKKKVLSEATLWKQRKIMELAAVLLPGAELKTFHDTLYPEQGLPDPLKRIQAINKLREKLESRNK